MLVAAAIGASRANAESPAGGPHASSRQLVAQKSLEPDGRDAAEGGDGGEGGEGGQSGVGGEAGEGGADDGGAAASAKRAVAVPEDQAQVWGGGAEIALVSRFIWRGMALSPGPAVQPTAWLSYAGVSAAIWTNLLLEPDPERHRLSAVEPELAYESNLGPLRVEPRLTLYWMRELPAAEVTTEAQLELALPVFGPLSVVNTHQLDVMKTPGAYYGTLGPRVEYQLGPLRYAAFCDVGYATAPFNRVYFDVHTPAFDVLEAGLAARWDLAYSLYASANAGVSALLASSLRAASSEPNLAYFGLAFGFER